MYAKTTALKKIAKLEKRYRMIAGGTSASKTISVLTLLIAQAQSDKKPTLTSVVSESFPHLKRGAIRDFLNIMQEHGYYRDDRWNKTDFTYIFESGSRIEFFSADQPSKVRGPRRDRLFVNELNNVPKEAFEQMAVRTKDVIYADWNPVAEFYAYEEYIGQRDDVDFIILTYLDNEGLSKQIVDEIEKRRINKNWWTVYGLGQLGEAEGRIYSGWNIIDDIPPQARLIRRGLDFGYSIDPAAIVDIYEYNGGYILDEILYQTGMTNQNLADFLKNQTLPQTLVIADSAEPKSIDEIKLAGVNIIPTVKGRDSVNFGIQLVKDKPIQITKRSVNGLKEYRTYMWKTDRDGKTLTIPEPGSDHFLDAVRYAISSDQPTKTFDAYKPQNMLKRKHK